MKQKITILLALIVAVVWPAELATAATPPRQPNIVVILADDKY